MGDKVVEIDERLSYLKTEERFSLVILGRLQGNTPKYRILWAIAWVIIGLVLTLEAKRIGVTGDERMILLIFMAFWGYYLYRIIKAIRWHQVGKEMLMMKGEYLIHKNSFGQIGKSKQYHLANVQPMQIKEKTEGWGALFEDSFWSIGRATIELAIDGRTLQIGFRLDKGSANKVISLFNQELRARQKALG